MPSATLDATELLDVDMDQLTRHLAFVAHSGLEPETTELAHPDLRQDPRDRRECHPKHLADLRASHPQAPQGGDRLDAPLIRAVGDP
jgi:hypothetical protein